MAWTGISNTVPQYEENGIAASGYYIKFYVSGTVTPIPMATDLTGATTLAKCILGNEGYPLNGSGAEFIPHIDQTYKIILYRNSVDADNDTTANAVWVVDDLDPVLSSESIFADNYQYIRDLTSTDETIYAKGQVTAGDGGEGFFQKITGAAPGTYIDDNYSVLVPTGGDGSVGWISRANKTTTTVFNYSTLNDAVVSTTLIDGQAINLKERTAGNGGAAMWDVVLASTVTPNTFDIVASTGIPTLALVLRYTELPSITKYGAIGDDTTENAALFTYLESISQPEFYVPHSTYKITGITLAKTYRGPGVLKIDGAIKDNDKDFAYIDPQGSRNSLNWGTANKIAIKGKQFPMGGFRMHGCYYKAKGKVVESPAFLTDIDIDTSLPFGLAATEPGWFAVFATCAQGETAPTFIVMPYIRAGVVAGSVVTFNDTQENSTVPTARTNTWTVNAMVDTDILVINETISGRLNSFSGRVAKVTANTTTTVTLDTIGAVAIGDWLLPAPNNKEYYRYCGSFFYEDNGAGTESIRNIADTATVVKAKMTVNSTAPAGQQASAVRLPWSTLISPLASAVIVTETSSFGTSGTGEYASTYASDSSAHYIAETYETKEATATLTYVADGLILPFAFAQDTWYLNGGSLAASRSGGKIEIKGWIET